MNLKLSDEKRSQLQRSRYAPYTVTNSKGEVKEYDSLAALDEDSPKEITEEVV